MTDRFAEQDTKMKEMILSIKKLKDNMERVYEEANIKYKVMISLDDIIQTEFKNRENFKRRGFWKLLGGITLVLYFTSGALWAISHYLSNPTTSIIKQDYAFLVVIAVSSIVVKELFSHYRDMIKISCGDYTNNQKTSSELTSLMREVLNNRAD